MKFITLIFLLIFSLSSIGQSNSTLVISNDSIFAEGNYADLENGQKVFLQFDITNSLIRSIYPVDSIMDSTRTVTVTLNGNTLSVQNTFDQALNYNAYVYSQSTQSFIPLPVYPVNNGLSSYEVFPYSPDGARTSGIWVLLSLIHQLI